jgi:hypothetical protein
MLYSPHSCLVQPEPSFGDTQRVISVCIFVRAHSEPIHNPVTDREEQMILVLPNGWVFHEAVSTSTLGALAMYPWPNLIMSSHSH